MRRSSGSRYGAVPMRNRRPCFALCMALAAAVFAGVGCRGPERTQVTVIGGTQPAKAAAPAEGQRLNIMPGARLSPDGKMLATDVMSAVRNSRTHQYVMQVWFMDADSGQVLAMTDPAVQSMFYRWGPGNSYLMSVERPGHASQLVWARSPTEAYTTIAPNDRTLGDRIRGVSPHFDPQMKWVVVEASPVGAPEDDPATEVLAIPLRGGKTHRIRRGKAFVGVGGFVNNPRKPEMPMVLVGGQVDEKACGSEVAAIAIPSGAVLWRAQLSDDSGTVGEIQPYGPGQVIVPLTIGEYITPGSGIHTEIWQIDLATGRANWKDDIPADCDALVVFQGRDRASIFMASSWDVWQIGFAGSGTETRKVVDGSISARPWGPIRRISNGGVEAYFWSSHSLYRCHLEAGTTDLFWGRRLLSDDPPRVAR